MAAEKHQPGEVPGEPHNPESGFHRQCLFARRETSPRDALRAGERRALIDTVQAPKIFDESVFLFGGKSVRASLRRRLPSALFIQRPAAQKFKTFEGQIEMPLAELFLQDAARRRTLLGGKHLLHFSP